MRHVRSNKIPLKPYEWVLTPKRSFPRSENEADTHVKAIEWESDAISNPSIPFKVITGEISFLNYRASKVKNFDHSNISGLKRKAPVVQNDQPKKNRPEDEISRILSQTLQSTIDGNNVSQSIIQTKKDQHEIDQSNHRLDYNQNSQKQKPIIPTTESQQRSPNSQQNFPHRVCNLIRHTSELRSEIQASLPPTTASSISPPTQIPSNSPVSSPTSISSHPSPVLGQAADRPAYPLQPGPMDGPADYVKNEPSRSLYGRLQSNFPATDFPKIDRSTNMFNLGTRLDAEKFTAPPKLMTPPKLTRPPLLTDHSRLGLGNIRGRFEMPTLSKYPKFENRNSNTDCPEKPFIKLEPEDRGIKDSKIEKTYDEPQERFQFSKYHHFYIIYIIYDQLFMSRFFCIKNLLEHVWFHESHK